MKNKHICKNCNKIYFNYKQHSTFCSKECKTQYNNISYNCDYCGKAFVVYRNKIEALNLKKHKHLYCSRECANNGCSNSVIKTCEHCGKNYKIVNSFKEIQRFCSRNCYDEYREQNSILKKHECPICYKTFDAKNSKQIYCSVNCRSIASENKVKCVCEYCGTEFFRIKSEVENAHKHYCSLECKNNRMYWSTYDTYILKTNYGNMSYSNMLPLFESKKTIDEVRRRAAYLKITHSREWTKEETETLKLYYSSKPMSEILKLIPNRTQNAIMRQAQKLGIKSYFYLSEKYTDEENEYLRTNYLYKTNEELAFNLNRSQKAISQHLNSMGLYRNYNKDYSNYKDLSRYVRANIQFWVNKIKKDFDYTCQITGKKGNVVLHHIHSFNLILSEAIETLNLPIYDEISLYTQQELDRLIDTFLEIQNFYNSYICISEDIHSHFHQIYKCGNNTKEQWDNFISQYYS